MKPLDFIVFGVGRSGTTALASALNLHPEILCGIERFHYTVPPAQIVYPDSFHDPTFRAAATNVKATLDAIEAKSDIRFAGNKNPRYFCRLADWQSFAPATRKIAIYRSPWHYLASWKARAERPGDPWHPSQQGAFGLYELFSMLRSTINWAPDTLLVPYDAVYFDNPQTILDAVRHIGADPTRFPNDQFLQTIFGQSHRSRQRPKLDGDVTEMLEIAGIDTLDSILLQANAFVIGERKAEIAAWLERVPARLAEVAEASIREREDEQMHALLERWIRHFPQLPSDSNRNAVPATFLHYHDVVFGSGRTQQHAAQFLCQRTGAPASISMALAKSYLDEGRAREAEAVYTDLIRRSPSCQPAYIKLTRLLVARRHFLRALRVALASIRRFGSSSIIRDWLPLVTSLHRRLRARA